MIKVKELELENGLGFVLDGKMDETELASFFQALDQKAERFGKVRLYGELQDLDGWKDFKSFLTHMKGNFKSIGKLEKYAVVSGKGWMDYFEDVTDFLTPNIDIKFFDMDEKAEALEWLKGPLKKDIPGSKKLDLGIDGVLGIQIHDRLTQADYKWFNQAMADQVASHGRIHLFMEIDDFEGVSLNAIWDDFKTGVKYYRDFKKVAITGGEGWLKHATKVGNFLTPGIEMKYFSEAEKHKALEWLR